MLGDDLSEVQPGDDILADQYNQLVRRAKYDQLSPGGYSDPDGTYQRPIPHKAAASDQYLRLSSNLNAMGTATGYLQIRDPETGSYSDDTDTGEVDVYDKLGNWGVGTSTRGEIIQVKKRTIDGETAYEAMSHGACEYGMRMTTNHPGKGVEFTVTLGPFWDETDFDYSDAMSATAIDQRANAPYPTASEEEPIYGLVTPRPNTTHGTMFFVIDLDCAG